MFSKQQRQVLAKLSTSIWGVETRWQKFYESGALDVVVSETEVDEAVTQVQLTNSKKRGRGTIYNSTTAPDRVLRSIAGGVPETVKVKKYDRRKPLFEEIVVSLTDMARSTLYSYLKPEQLVNVFAVDFSSGENIQLNLVKKEDEQYSKDLSTLLDCLPGDVREKVEAMNEGIPVDAVEFVSELLFVRSHKDHALEMYNLNLELGAAAHKALRRKMAVKQRLGL